MHLQRVQVPDFRVLKDVDITFEKNFNPRVFPLGSQNGGGKSTLLQLIFVLLHCSANPDRHFAIQNLLGDFHLQDGEEERTLAIMDVWNGELLVQLEFFVCGSSYLQQKYNIDSSQDIDTDVAIGFNLFTEFETLQSNLSGFEEESNQLKILFERFKSTHISGRNSARFWENFKHNLSILGLEVPSGFRIEQLDSKQFIRFETELKNKLSNRHKYSKQRHQNIDEHIHKLIDYLALESIKYITAYNPENMSEGSDLEGLLCRIKNIDFDEHQIFLESLADKVFLSAPSTQIFLFLDKQSRQSLFINKSTYQSDLARVNSDLHGLFTYDFLATDIFIKAFEKARDKDFKEALKTGEYGKNYRKLLRDLDLLLLNKKINLKDDFSGLTFKLDRFNKDSIELYPEDLSHGELKRLSIYVWLKYQDIEDAIVLMDEVDLALHPDWQYQIVSDLLDWVSSNQYILATHSYELCNALTPSHVKILEPKLTERRSD
jgi:predicted ATP-dependent endonuclease of OLD family